MAITNMNTAIGVSFFKGVYKPRFAQDMVGRIKTLTREHHTDVRFIELPEPQDAVTACETALAHEMFQDEPIQECLKQYIENRGHRGDKKVLTTGSDKPVKEGRIKKEKIKVSDEDKKISAEMLAIAEAREVARRDRELEQLKAKEAEVIVDPDLEDEPF